MCKQHCWHELRQHAIKRWLERAKKTSYICTYHLVQFTDSPVFFTIIQPNGKSLVCAPLPLETFVCWLILNEHKCLIMRRWFNWYLKLFYCHSSSELISNELRKCTHKSGAQTFHMKIYNILICLPPAHTSHSFFEAFHIVSLPRSRYVFVSNRQLTKFKLRILTSSLDIFAFICTKSKLNWIKIQIIDAKPRCKSFSLPAFCVRWESWKVIIQIIATAAIIISIIAIHV